jgi:hypothetical protein
MTTATPLRGKWGRLAERLGLTPVRSSHFPGFVRCLVGFHGGYLVSISPASSFRSSSVDILVRYPRSSTVRGFWDDIVNDRTLAEAFGRKRRMPRSRRKDVLVGDGSLLLRLTYDFFPPSAKRIERVTKGLVETLSHHMRPLERVCELCNQNREPGVYLADGVPALVCGTCLEDYRNRERDYAERLKAIPPDVGRGFGLGLGAALAFGLAAGALAAIPKILLPTVGFVIGLPLFAALGFGVSLFMSRGYSGFSVGSVLAKVPVCLIGGIVGFTTSNAVTSMTVGPEPFSGWLLWQSSIGLARALPHYFVAVLSASLVGWLAELVALLFSLRKRTRATEIESLELAV